jgi:Chaperone of endosialidase
MNPLIQLKTTSPLLITLALLCFELLPRVQAVVPAPDGGYPNFNTAEGQKALFNLTTGSANTAVGWNSLFSDTEGSFNTATGAGSLLFNTADENTAFGAAALLFNTTGETNTAIGTAALLNNTEGLQNTASGAFALLSNTTGNFNTASGVAALANNTTGDSNSAFGWSALASNTTGGSNTAIGRNALLNNTEGTNNTANGFDALLNNTTGFNNVATGDFALAGNTIGTDNIALGSSAGLNLTTGDLNIDIGNLGVVGDHNTIRIGTVGQHGPTFIAGIRGGTTGVGDAIPVLIDSAGQLGTISSSRRFKKEIKPMNQTSEAILALKPVTFHYKSDNKGTPQFGLIAEEVAAVNPDLVMRDENGEIYTVRYDAVNAMLLNEFLREHRRVDQLTKTFQSKLAEQQKQIEALTAGLQKVSAQLAAASPSDGGLEASKFATGRIRGGGPAPQVVNNP